MLLNFSDIHPWQGNLSVMQILVFPSDEARMHFDALFKVEVELHGVETASDNKLGAIYKLRAVRNNKGMFIPLLRCGFSGKHLWESSVAFENANGALKECLRYLASELTTDLMEHVKLF